MNSNPFSELVECANKVFSDTEHYYQATHAFIQHPYRVGGQCGLCYLSAAYYGCVGKHVDQYTSPGQDIAKQFHITVDAVSDIMYLNDVSCLTWEEISQVLSENKLDEAMQKAYNDE